jgi:hypothetical protein
MTNVALLDVAVISVIIAVSKLLDGISDLISDLIIGDIIDNKKILITDKDIKVVFKMGYDVTVEA